MDIMLIDDHPLLNAGLISILEGTGIFTVSAQAVSLNQAMDIIEEAEDLPHLIILDILLGEDNGLDFLPMLEAFCRRKKIRKPAVLVCSALDDAFKVQSALKLGASGFLSKTSGKSELLNAIDTILCGEVYISSEMNSRLSESSKIYSKFSKREIDVINAIKQNKINKIIASDMGISIRTVENYISKIYFKTGFSTREEINKL